jgi:antitoxin VapB
MQPRRNQPAVTFRSQKAVDRLKVLTRDGRSQVEVIEDALERAPEPADLEAADRDAFMSELRQICARIAKKPRRWKTLAEFDAHEYDERGNLR